MRERETGNYETTKDRVHGTVCVAAVLPERNDESVSAMRTLTEFSWSLFERSFVVLIIFSACIGISFFFFWFVRFENCVYNIKRSDMKWRTYSCIHIVYI